LKYWTSRSCRLACTSVENVPRLRRLPVEASFFLEYKRYSPVLSFRIIGAWMHAMTLRWPVLRLLAKRTFREHTLAIALSKIYLSPQTIELKEPVHTGRPRHILTET